MSDASTDDAAGGGAAGGDTAGGDTAGGDTAGGGGARPIAVVDIDGVVADVRHRVHHLERSPKDWDAFFAAAAQDPVHPEGVAVVEQLAADHDVVFLTGRPAWLADVTQAWLDHHGMGGNRLVMRPRYDRRPAAVVKPELLRRVAAGRSVAVVVDDDAWVLRAMAEAGYPVFAAEWERMAPEDRVVLTEAQENEGRT